MCVLTVDGGISSSIMTNIAQSTTPISQFQKSSQVLSYKKSIYILHCCQKFWWKSSYINSWQH